MTDSADSVSAESGSDAGESEATEKALRAGKKGSRRAKRPASSGAGSDADVGPAAAAAKAELRADTDATDFVETGKPGSAKPPFVLGGSPARSDASLDTSLDAVPTSRAAAAKARELLGKLLASRDDVERRLVEARARDGAGARAAQARARPRDRRRREGGAARATSPAASSSCAAPPPRRSGRARAHGPAAYAALEQRGGGGENEARGADGARLKAVTGDIKGALDRVKAEKAKVSTLRSLAAAEARAAERQASRTGGTARLPSRLQAGRRARTRGARVRRRAAARRRRAAAS